MSADEAQGSGETGGKVAVIGAGAWGTTLAWMLGRRGRDTALWARRPELAEEMRLTRRNSAYRPEVELPADVTPTADMAEALSGATAAILAVPSHVVREVLRAAQPLLPPSLPVVIAAKGLERGSGKRMTQVAGEVLGAEAGGPEPLRGDRPRQARGRRRGRAGSGLETGHAGPFGVYPLPRLHQL